MRIIAGLFVALTLTCSDFVCAVELAPQKRSMTINGQEVFIPCIVSENLLEVAPRISRVVFSIHSSGFDAEQYFENAKVAASKVPEALNTTLIIAPQFSAGGQFVQRYAMVGKFSPPAGINYRFVVSAPSSYASLAALT